MIISMTGFGRGEATANGYTATVEIKSLNSRYLDITSKLPAALQDKEYELKEILQKHINRGKLNVIVHLSDTENGIPSIKVDEIKVKHYAGLLRQVAKISGINTDITLSDLAGFADIFSSETEDEDAAAHKWEAVKTALEEALDNLIRMRTREGDHLKEDFLLRLDTIGSNLEAISEISENRAEEVRSRLRERITALLEDESFDRDRLETEVALLADKMDITEEIVRLRAHLTYFGDAIEQAEKAGRRLNFLTQEMNRELNTMGAKANDSGISHFVIHSKEMLEQIREQIQNVE